MSIHASLTSALLAPTPWPACQVLHRDIKPGNIMVTSQEVVKIGDLGIAKILKGMRAAWLLRAAQGCCGVGWLMYGRVTGKLVARRHSLR